MIYVVLIAQFCQVFALVMSSKLLRDDRWVLAMANSILITFTQFIFVYTVSTQTDTTSVLIASAIGGSLGCGASHLFYTKILYRGKSNGKGSNS